MKRLQVGYDCIPTIFKIVRIVSDDGIRMVCDVQQVASIQRDAIVWIQNGDTIRAEIIHALSCRYIRQKMSAGMQVYLIPYTSTSAEIRTKSLIKACAVAATDDASIQLEIEVQDKTLLVEHCQEISVYPHVPDKPLFRPAQRPQPLDEEMRSGLFGTVVIPECDREAELRAHSDTAYTYVRPHNEVDLRRAMRYISYSPMTEFLSKNVPVRLPLFEYSDTTLRIGYVVMDVPPQSISVVHRSGLLRLPLLRGAGTIKKSVPLSLPIVSIQFTVDKGGVSSILIPLLRQVDRMPFLPVENRLLNYTHNIHGLAIQDIQVSTVEGAPDALNVSIVAATFHEKAIRFSHYRFGENWCWPLFKLYTDFRPNYVDQFTTSEDSDVTFQLPSVEWLSVSDLSNLDPNMMNENVRTLVGSLFKYTQPDLMTGSPRYADGPDILYDPDVLFSVTPLSEPIVVLDSPYLKGYAIRAFTFEQLEVLLLSFIGAFTLTSGWVEGNYSQPAVVQYKLSQGTKKLYSLSMQEAVKLADELTKYLDTANDTSSQDGGERRRWQEILATTWFYLPDLRYLSMGPFVHELTRNLARYVTSHPNLDKRRNVPQYEDVPIGGVTWTGVTVQQTNMISELDNVGTEPVLQFLGKGDTIIKITGICESEEAARDLRVLYDYFRALSFTYRGLALTQGYGGYLRVVNNLIGSMGVEYAIPMDITFGTIPGVPDAQQVEITLISFQPLQNELMGYRRVGDVNAANRVTVYGREQAMGSVTSEFSNWVRALMEVELYPDLRVPHATDVIAWIDAIRRIGMDIPLDMLSDYERMVYMSLYEIWGTETRTLCKQYSGVAPKPKLYRISGKVHDYYMDPDFFVAYRDDLFNLTMSSIVTDAHEGDTTAGRFVDMFDVQCETSTPLMDDRSKYGPVHTSGVTSPFDYRVEVVNRTFYTQDARFFTDIANIVEKYVSKDRVLSIRNESELPSGYSSFLNRMAPYSPLPNPDGSAPISVDLRNAGLSSDRALLERAKGYEERIRAIVGTVNQLLFTGKRPVSSYSIVHKLGVSTPQNSDVIGDSGNSRDMVLLSQLQLNPSIIHAIITVESGWRHDAISSKGARGLMQVTHWAAESARRVLGSYYRPDWATDVDANLRVGITYFGQAVHAAAKVYAKHRDILEPWIRNKILQGNPIPSTVPPSTVHIYALAAMYYNAGPGGFSTIVEKVKRKDYQFGGYAETITYSRNVMTYYLNSMRYRDIYTSQARRPPSNGTSPGSSGLPATPSGLSGGGDSQNVPPASLPPADRQEYQGENETAGLNWFLTGWQDELTQFPSNRLLLCFPTVSVMVILGFRWIRQHRFWNQFYGMYGLMSVDVWKSRRHPSDVAELVFANVFNTMGMHSWFQAYETEANKYFSLIDRDNVQTLPDYLVNILKRLPREVSFIFGDPLSDPNIRDMWSREYRGLMLKPGIKLHIRMGYGANLYELEPMFSGVITEANIEEGQISVVAQGFGAQLENPLGVKVYKRMGFLGTGDEPRNIISNLFTATPTGPLNLGVAINVLSGGRWLHRNAYGIEDFGMVVYNSNVQWDDAEAGVNLYNSQPIAENVSPWAFGYYNIFGLGDLIHSTHSITVEVENGTPWDVIRACQLSIFDYIASVVPFEFRSTLFFGAGYHPLYYSYRLDLNEQDAARYVIDRQSGSGYEPVDVKDTFEGWHGRGPGGLADTRTWSEDMRNIGRDPAKEWQQLAEQRTRDIFTRVISGPGSSTAPNTAPTGGSIFTRVMSGKRGRPSGSPGGNVLTFPRPEQSKQPLFTYEGVRRIVGWARLASPLFGWYSMGYDILRSGGDVNRFNYGDSWIAKDIFSLLLGGKNDSSKDSNGSVGAKPGTETIPSGDVPSDFHYRPSDSTSADPYSSLSTKGNRGTADSPMTQNMWARLMHAKQFRQYHIILSDYNLLSNQISASSEKVYTQVAAMDTNGTPGNMIMLDPFIIGEDQRMKVVKSNLYTSIMQRLNLVDGNWLSLFTSLPILRGLFESVGAVTPVRTVNNVAVNTMREGLMDMYQGSVTIIGNPGIKPYDLCYINDSTTRLAGPFFVKEVIHKFAIDHGFVSMVAPDAVVVTNRDKELASILYASSVAHQIMLQVYYRKDDTEVVSSIGVDEYAIQGMADYDAGSQVDNYWIVTLPSRLVPVRAASYRAFGMFALVFTPVALRYMLNLMTFGNRRAKAAKKAASAAQTASNAVQEATVALQSAAGDTTVAIQPKSKANATVAGPSGAVTQITAADASQPIHETIRISTSADELYTGIDKEILIRFAQHDHEQILKQLGSAVDALSEIEKQLDMAILTLSPQIVNDLPPGHPRLKAFSHVRLVRENRDAISRLLPELVNSMNKAKDALTAGEITAEAASAASAEIEKAAKLLGEIESHLKAVVEVANREGIFAGKAYLESVRTATALAERFSQERVSNLIQNFRSFAKNAESIEEAMKSNKTPTPIQRSKQSRTKVERSNLSTRAQTKKVEPTTPSTKGSTGSVQHKSVERQSGVEPQKTMEMEPKGATVERNTTRTGQYRRLRRQGKRWVDNKTKAMESMREATNVERTAEGRTIDQGSQPKVSSTVESTASRSSASKSGTATTRQMKSVRSNTPTSTTSSAAKTVAGAAEETLQAESGVVGSLGRKLGPLGERASKLLGKLERLTPVGKRVIKFFNKGNIYMIIGQGILDWISRWLDQYYACMIVPLRVDGMEYSAGIRGHVGSVIGDNPSFIQSSLEWLDPEKHPWASMLAGLLGISKTSDALHNQAEDLKDLYREITGTSPSKENWALYKSMLDSKVSEFAGHSTVDTGQSSTSTIRHSSLVPENEIPPQVRATIERSRPPVIGAVKLTSDQGPRNPRIGSKFHQGLDMVSTNLGSRAPVVATLPGTVAYAGMLGSFGNLVVVDHGNGLYSYYGHLSRIHVRVGDTVKDGQTLGIIGSTGRSTGVHLHFEYRVGKRWDDSSPIYIPDSVQNKILGKR